MIRNSYSVLIKHCSAFHTTNIRYGNRSKVILKIMGGTKKRKFYPSDIPILPPTTNIFEKTSFESKITGNPRRTVAVNKLLMRHITDLMATGEYSNQLIGYGIEINKVKITPDRKILRVYWIANKSKNYDEIENLLKKNAGLLKKELCELRVMGEVPNIVFVKDKTYTQMIEIEQKLAQADFGVDCNDSEENITHEYDILSLNSPYEATLEKFNAESKHKNYPNNIPPMPQNVLGLDHASILNRIKKGMSISKAEHRENSSESSEWSQWSQFKMTQPVNSNPVAYSTQQEQRKAFKEFLQQRKILKMKQNKMNKNWGPDIEVLREDLNERHFDSIDYEVEYKDDDFITEETEEVEK